MKMKSVLSAVLAGAAVSAFAAGENYQTAIAMSSAQTVHLVEEVDPVFGPMGVGTAWYKLTVKKGDSATVWIQDGDVDKVTLMSWADPSMTKEIWPMADFTWGSAPRTVQALFLESSSWDESDPNTWTFYFNIFGMVGDKVNMYCTAGIHSFNEKGAPDNPVVLTVKDSEQKTSVKVLELDTGYEYYWKTKLEAGRKYLFKTSGGSAAKPLTLNMGGLMVEEVPAGDGNVGYYAFPEKTENYVFNVSANSAGQNVTLAYQSVPKRPIANHPVVDLDKSNRTAAIVPGRMVADAAYYDGIVDETLCRVTLTGGERVIFETVDAEEAIEMIVYDADGNELKRNSTDGSGANCRCALEAEGAKAFYYVGVYDPQLKVDDDPAGGDAVTLRVVDADDYAGDNYDPEDDEDEGANLLDPAPTESPEKTRQAVDPTQVGSPHGSHVLTRGDWQDIYVIRTREDVTYALRAAFDDPKATSVLHLDTEVYYYTTKGKTIVKNVVPTLGNIAPGMGMPLTFMAETEGLYYIRVSVAEGEGLDYPAHSMYAAAYLDGEDAPSLCKLRVKTPGYAGAEWWLDKESTRYADGDAVLVPAGAHKVNFATYDSGKTFVTPAVQNIKLAASAEETVVFGTYRDKFDPADNSLGGAVSLTVAAKESTTRRTLWHAGEYGMAEDPADWFAFTAKSGIYYNFALKDVAGDAVCSICDSKQKPVPGGEATAEPLRRLHLGDGKFFVKVAHAAATADGGAYSLVCNSANVGALSFKATNVSVKDSAASVQLVVKRSAKEGRLRVNYATHEGTAKPGERYYPAVGTLVWEDGDNKDKTITVRLIPKLVATYTADCTFSVQLTPMDEDDLEDGEYQAQFSGPDAAKVTLVSSTKAVAGTVAVSAFVAGDSVSTTTVANVKKPVAAVTAGEPLKLIVTRANGTAGAKVAVQLTTANGKAVGGTDFVPLNEILEWEAGDNSPKTVTIQTKNSGFYTASKAFSVKLTALTSGAYKGWQKPTISGSTVAVTLVSPTVEMELKDYAKLAKAAGVTLSGSGTWVHRTNGSLACAPLGSGDKAKAEMTWTVSGPGVLTLVPEVSGAKAKLVYAVGKGAATEWKGGTVRLMLDKGKQSVKFTLTGSGAAVAFARTSVLASADCYEWLRFADVAPLPVNKGVISHSVSGLAWAYPAGYAADDLCVRVKFGTSSKSVSEVIWSGRGKDCALPAVEDGATYYWTLDYALSDAAEPVFDELDWTASGTVWQFGVSEAGKAPSTVTEGVDIWGEPIEDGAKVTFLQGVGVDFPLTSGNGIDGTTAALVAGKLPDGVKLDAKKMKVAGVPTKAGSYKAVLQLKNGNTQGETLAFDIEVLELGTAEGTFSGVLMAEDGGLVNGLPGAASVKFTSNAKGSLSATVSLAGKSYKFSSKTGFAEVFPVEVLGSPVNHTVQVTLVNKTTVNKVAYENLLTVTLNDCDVDDLRALGTVGGSVELTMNVPDASGKGVQPEVVYTGSVYRDNTKSADYQAALADFVGYYTVSLMPFAVEPGSPEGNGYLTLKVDAKGKVKVAGKLADGTSVSQSPVGALIGALDNPRACTFVVPLFAAKSPYCFAGELKLAYAEDELGTPATAVDSDLPLIWNKDGAQTYDGEAFREILQPVGGWYNTLYNLEAYYLGWEFAVRTGDYTQFDEPLSAGYTYAAEQANGLPVSLAGNALSVAKRSLAKNPFNKKLYDLAESINPANVSVKFTRSTGLVSGSFSIWTEAENAQKEIKKINHYGVVTLSRGENSPMDESVLSSGFFLLPMKVSGRSWSASLPFDIVGDYTDPDWSEPDLPVESN